ncbi:MAG: DUF5808 domain-containing protein [Actinomycetota bacterium]|nr:DUF5808 domain-containing protein [Actinomycetota bacterium]
MRRSRRLLGYAVAGTTAAALGQELRKPADQRSWNGHVFGFVPYDFRVPTLERLRSAWWAPDRARIFTPRVFGVGWDVNLGRVVHLLRRT